MANIKKYKYKSMEGLQRAVYVEQLALIREMFGQKAADELNLGWGVAADKGELSVASKVYLPKGSQVITTNTRIGACREWFDHNLEEY